MTPGDYKSKSGEFKTNSKKWGRWYKLLYFYAVMSIESFSGEMSLKIWT